MNMMAKRCMVLLLLILLLCQTGCANTAQQTYRLYEGEIETQEGVYVDTTTMKLTFGDDLTIRYEGKQLDLGGKTFDIFNFRNNDGIYYDPKLERLSPVGYDGSIRIGTFHLPVFTCELGIEQGLIYVNQVPATVWQEMYEKNYVFLGDSMTQGTGTNKTYSRWLSELCGGFKATEYGLEGSCIAPKVDEIPTWEVGIESFYERYSSMDDNADVVVVFGSANDWATGRELGSPTDSTTDTFCGAVRALCIGLKEKYPDAEIFFFSSPQNNFVARPANNLSGTDWEGNKEGYNRKGYQLQDYAEAMEVVCAELDVNFCSLTEKLPWGEKELGNYGDVDGLYGTDGLHPNSEGHALIAKEMQTYMQMIFAEN